jgi:hypothetical protein
LAAAIHPKRLDPWVPRTGCMGRAGETPSPCSPLGPAGSSAPPGTSRHDDLIPRSNTATRRSGNTPCIRRAGTCATMLPCCKKTDTKYGDRFILHYDITFTVGRTFNTAYRIFTSPVSESTPPRLNNVKARYAALPGFTSLQIRLLFVNTCIAMRSRSVRLRSRI